MHHTTEHHSPSASDFLQHQNGDWWILMTVFLDLCFLSQTQQWKGASWLSSLSQWWIWCMRTARKTEAKSFRLWLVQSVVSVVSVVSVGCKRENRSAATLWMGFGAAFLHVAISIFQYTLVLQVVNWYCWCCAYLWMGPQPHWLCASEETDDSQKRCEITLRNQTDITACQADSSCICASVSLNGGTSLWDQRNWMNCWNSLDPQAETERSESECVLQPTSLISHWKPCSWIIQLYTCHEADKLPSTEGFSPLEHVLIWGRRMFGACIPIIGVARCADDQASCSLKVFLCLLGCMLSSAFGNGRVNRKNALNFIVLVVLQVFLQRTSPIRTPHRGAKVLWFPSIGVGRPRNCDLQLAFEPLNPNRQWH